MTRYFEDFQPYYVQLASGNFSGAVDSGLEFLGQTRSFSEADYERAHKGTPFYFLGLAAFRCHDYETGAFLIDAAMAEDSKNHPNSDTPAKMFMRLETKNSDQAGYPLVEQVSERLEQVALEYRARTDNAGLTANDVQRRFLEAITSSSSRTELRSLATAFIAFLAEWRQRACLINLASSGSREIFYFHLFKGCVLFESIIKANNRKRLTQTTLGRILQVDLSAELNIPAPFSSSGSDLETIVRSLTHTLSVGEAVEKTAQMRNSVGHNIAWLSNSLDGQMYDLAVTTIAIACLHAIAKLYV